ncbi:MAG TPA: hypothetical protein VG753_00710 [Candidatus Paceibacterota bacterium]|nr:hypothetical protein [Candidatus Paceibacterota bacterium]
MIRGALLLLIAIFIDLLQACISMTIFAIASAPGTALGGAGGAIAGAKLCSAAGSFLSGLCATAGGFVFGLLGSTLNPFLLPYTEPLGAAAGFAIDICLSATLGSFLIVMVSMFIGKIPLKAYFCGLGEILPGFNNLPLWTGFVIFCLLNKEAQEGSGVLSSVAKIATAGSSPTGILSAAGGALTAAAQPAPQSPGTEASANDNQNPQNTREQGRTPALVVSRSVDTDIRPSTPRAANTNLPAAANDNLLRGIQAHAA